MDMTSIWSAEHGWSYLNAIIDCCTREITAWSLDVRCRHQEATAVLEQAVADRRIEPRTLVLGSDNGTAYTSRARLAELEVTHRRGGYRDPESQAFIESWFSKLIRSAGALGRRWRWPRRGRRRRCPADRPFPPHAWRSRSRLRNSRGVSTSGDDSLSCDRSESPDTTHSAPAAWASARR